MAELFPEFASTLAGEETVAVLVTVPLKPLDVLNVDVMMAEAPEMRLPMSQGNAPVHAPVLETQVALEIGGSVTIMPVAVVGPLLVTVIV